MILLASLPLAACGAPEPAAHLAIPGADPVRGRALVRAYGCGACHVVPGIGEARGRTGPSLEAWSARKLLAGRLGNTPENLVAWLLDPPALAPRTGMPAQGLREAEARDVAAFLYTLESGGSAVAPPAAGLDSGAVPRPRSLPGRGPFVGG